MKYTYTFETTDAYIGLIQKVNNFLIQVFDGIKYVDKESPINEKDYSITQDVQEDEVKMYFNMDTKSKALRCLMNGVVDLLLDSIFRRSFRSEELIGSVTITDIEESWTPVEYCNFVLNEYTDYNVTSETYNENINEFDVSFHMPLKNNEFKRIKAVLRNMGEHIRHIDPYNMLWITGYTENSLRIKVPYNMSNKCSKYVSDMVLSIMRYLFGEDDLSSILPDNIKEEEPRLIEREYDESDKKEEEKVDNVEEVEEDESDIFVPTKGKSIVKNIENYVTSCRPEPIAREGVNQIAMVYTDIDKGDTDVYNRIIRIFHYVLIGYSLCNPFSRSKSLCDYANGNISIEYINNVPTVILKGNCRIDTLDVFKAMNEFLRIYTIYYASSTILDEFDRRIETGMYAQLYRDFMEAYRASVKQMVHKIDEKTKFEKYFNMLLSNILYATMFPDRRMRVKADIVPVKSLFVLETILAIKYGLGTVPIVATDKIIFTLFSKFDRKSTEPLVIEFKSMTDSTVYDITGDNAQPLNEPFSISISRLSSNECIATITSLSDEINDCVCLPSLSAHLSISLSEKSFVMALFQYLTHVYFKRLEKDDDYFIHESMLTE